PYRDAKGDATMRTLALAVLLCVSAAATAQAGPDRPRSCESWRCKPAPAPAIGSGIPVALAIGGVLLATNLLGASAAILSSVRPEPFASGCYYFGAASAPVYALDRLSSSGSNTPVWMYSDGRMDGVSFGLVGS